METRRLGRLGHDSSVLIYGAAALSDVTQDVADRSIQEALDGGINHLDVAASYGDAELRLGPWMSQIRDRVFLATKTGERMEFGCYMDMEGRLWDGVHFPEVAARYPILGRGIYLLTGIIEEEFGHTALTVERAEKVSHRADPPRAG